MRSSIILRAGKSADHTLYHAEPKGFWKKFRDAVVVNPEISSGLPIPELNRNPAPASRTERYATPATEASDIAFNPYWKRDTRRHYPATSYVTQQKLANLLLASPEGQKALPPPASSATDVVARGSSHTLNEVLAALPQTFASAGGISVSSATGGLPPVAPAFGGKKWVPVQGDEIPHAPDAYWPMVSYR